MTRKGSREGKTIDDRIHRLKKKKKYSSEEIKKLSRSRRRRGRRLDEESVLQEAVSSRIARTRKTSRVRKREISLFGLLRSLALEASITRIYAKRLLSFSILIGSNLERSNKNRPRRGNGVYARIKVNIKRVAFGTLTTIHHSSVPRFNFPLSPFSSFFFLLFFFFRVRGHFNLTLR